MITAQYILEAYLDMFIPHWSVRKEPATVFVNPDASERRELIGETSWIKFIASHPMKNIYVWNANRAMHPDVYSQALKKDEIKSAGGILEGQVRPKQGNLYIYLADFEKKWPGNGYPNLLKYDWSWTHKYGIYLERETSVYDL